MSSRDDLGANSLTILMADSPSEAPSYNKPEHLFAKLTTAQIVGRGTVSGNPTVDFIFEDESGQKYVAMLTGRARRESRGRGPRDEAADRRSKRPRALNA